MCEMSGTGKLAKLIATSTGSELTEAETENLIAILDKLDKSSVATKRIVSLALAYETRKSLSPTVYKQFVSKQNQLVETLIKG